MGDGTFDPAAYRSSSFAQTAQTSAAPQQAFKARGMHPTLNPMGVKIRESRDSATNPNSTPIIVGLDETGSMGNLAGAIAKEGLETLFTSILDKKPISDPHIMFMGLGDALADVAPLQVSQFEADIRIVEQLSNLFLEGNGGGNGGESYHLAHYFAAFHTEHDSYQKRGKRGYLFTVGDEPCHGTLYRASVKEFTGAVVETDFTTKQLIELAQRYYDVYHIVIAEKASSYVLAGWRDLLGEKAIELKDHRALAETIVSAIQIAEGLDAQSATQGWGARANVVHNAVKSLQSGNKPKPKMLGKPA